MQPAKVYAPEQKDPARKVKTWAGPVRETKGASRLELIKTNLPEGCLMVIVAARVIIAIESDGALALTEKRVRAAFRRDGLSGWKPVPLEDGCADFEFKGRRAELGPCDGDSDAVAFVVVVPQPPHAAVAVGGSEADAGVDVGVEANAKGLLWACELTVRDMSQMVL